MMIHDLRQFNKNDNFVCSFYSLEEVLCRSKDKINAVAIVAAAVIYCENLNLLRTVYGRA